MPGPRFGARLVDRRLFGVALAAVVFLWSWALLDHGVYKRGRIVDTGVYQGYGLTMRQGEVPYRDFTVEYPPGALPAFLVPTYAGHPTDLGDYGRWFARLMAVCGLGCLAAVMLSRAPARGVAFVAVSPLLIGSLVLSRFDLWPTALAAGALALFLRGRHRLGWLGLGLAVAVKVFAVVLLPLAAVLTLKQRGRRELERGAAIWAVTIAAIFGPFAAIAPHGLWESLWGQFTRPIQVESLAASFLMTFERPGVIISHDSLAVGGHGTLALLTTCAEFACLLALWAGFARGPADAGRFVRFGAASVGAFIAFGKVLSPQYLIWLVPLVALVPGRRGLVALGLLAVALVDTQFWFFAPHYDAYVNEYRYAWLVFGRNLVLVGLVATLGLPAPGARRPDLGGAGRPASAAAG